MKRPLFDHSNTVVAECNHRCSSWPQILIAGVPHVICDICIEDGTPGTWAPVAPKPVQLTLGDIEPGA